MSSCPLSCLALWLPLPLPLLPLLLPLLLQDKKDRINPDGTEYGVEHGGKVGLQAQRNTTQHNTTQHNTTQHNTTQHNTTQRSRTNENLPPTGKDGVVVVMFLL
eukprot:COSAG06_NODE_3190_length_5707_cov_57.591655_5_plen_104_part_00